VAVGETAGGGLGQTPGERNNKGEPDPFGVLLVEPWKCLASLYLFSKVVLSAKKGSSALSPARLCGCRNDCQVSPPREQEGGTAEGEFCFTV